MMKFGTQHANSAGRTDDQAYPAYNVSGLMAWFAAVILGIVAMHIPDLARFSAPLTAVASFAFYCIAGRPVSVAAATASPR